MDRNLSYSTFQAFKPHFDALARVGYFKIVLKRPTPIRSKMHFMYRIIVWAIVLTYNLQHLIRLIQARHNTGKMVNILFILLTTLNTLGKQITFNVRSARVDHIISVIDGPIFAPREPYHVEVMKDNALTMHRLLKLYIVAIFTCGTLWTIFPLINRALGVEVEFTGYFPFDTSSSPAFELVVLYMNIFITLQAYGNVTMDCTIVAFYAQIKVQLQILRYNLEHIADDLDRANLTNARGYNELVGYKDVKDQIFKQRIQNRLAECIMHHRKMLWFKREIESIFAEAMLFQFLVTAWVICMTVYKIVGLSLLSAEFVSMAVYLGCMLAQLYIYCYYGTQVKYESEFVNRSVYCGDWLQLSPGFRRQLLVMMVNCSRAITPRTAYIIPISMETYIAVLRSSYTLFTFLDRK